jgi:hypothetical protein
MPKNLLDIVGIHPEAVPWEIEISRSQWQYHQLSQPLAFALDPPFFDEANAIFGRP